MTKPINTSKKLLSSILLFVSIFSHQSHLLASNAEAKWGSYKGSPDRVGVMQAESMRAPLKVSWTYKVDGKTNGFVDWGPVVYNGIAYTSDGMNHVVALNAKTGDIVWKKDFISNVFSVSFSEDFKILYVTLAITTKPTPTLLAVNPKTGETLWDNTVNGQPAVGGMEGGTVVQRGVVYAGYLQYEGHGGVVAYDGKTGKLLWHWSVKRFSPYSPLAFSNGKLYVGFENKTVNCIEAKTGNLVWSQELTDLPYGAPAVADKKVFVGAGEYVYALHANKGTIIWKKAVEGAVGHGSPSIYKDTIYVGTLESRLYALKTDNGDTVWSQNFEKGPIESSVLINSKAKEMYLATQGNWMLVLSLKDGSVKQSLRLSEDPRGVWKGTPALYEGKLYIGSLDRTFYAVE